MSSRLDTTWRAPLRRLAFIEYLAGAWRLGAALRIGTAPRCIVAPWSGVRSGAVSCSGVRSGSSSRLGPAAMCLPVPATG